MKFVVRRNKAGEFFWQLVGGNGEVMAVSESMPRKQSCLDSIESVKRDAAGGDVVDRTDEAAG
jgi:uncharacterized protein YegP (UPF0339 family)